MYCATLYLFFIEMMPGQIGWKSIEMMPGQIGQIRWLNWSIRPPNLTDLTRGKSLRLHCMPAQSNQLNWWSNWVEIIEITLYACLVKKSVDFHPI